MDIDAAVVVSVDGPFPHDVTVICVGYVGFVAVVERSAASDMSVMASGVDDLEILMPLSGVASSVGVLTGALISIAVVWIVCPVCSS